MNQPLRCWTALAAVGLLAAAAGAQPASPSLAYVYPAGARAGTTVQVHVGGQFLYTVKNARLSGAGVRVQSLQAPEPINQQQSQDLRVKLRELTAKAQAAARRPGQAPPLTDEERQLLARIPEMLAAFARRREAPAVAETVVLEITLAADAPPGRRELRLEGPQGLSNPLIFCVDELPEAGEAPARASEVLAATGSAAARQNRPPAPPPRQIELSLPTILNGQILPGEVDRYRFSARAAQRIVVAVAGRELIPYLADGVPGWFDPVVTIYDDAGNELACMDDTACHPDPLLCFEVPADGTYVLEIRDSLYRGREDFVYRVALGELPCVTGLFPLGGPVGLETPVQRLGWNLPPGPAMLPAADSPGVRPAPWPVQQGCAGRVLFAADSLPERLEAPTQDKPGGVQALTLPVIVNGRVERPGEQDVYSFQGNSGQRIVAEVLARRLGSPLDAVLTLTDAAGELVAFNDDHQDKAAGLVTHHADPYLSATLPTDGVYYLRLGDVQGNAGPAHAYRLRVSEPRPDFELRVAPSAIGIRGGATVPVVVHAIRRDGFDGEIRLSLREAPKGSGFALSGGRIPQGQDQIRLTLTAPATAPPGPIVLHLQGQADIAGRQVVRPVVAAEDMMQAFGYRHLVPIGDWQVSVTGRGQAPPTILSKLPLSIPAGGTADVDVAIPTGPALGEIHLELNDPPAGLEVQKLTARAGRVEISLRADADALAPSAEGNLIVNVFRDRPPTAQGGPARRISLGTLPAIPFRVVAP